MTGQDGPNLDELLLAKGYETRGTIRRASNITALRTGQLYVIPINPEPGSS